MLAKSLVSSEEARHLLSLAFTRRLEGDVELAGDFEESARFICHPREFAEYLFRVILELCYERNSGVQAAIIRLGKHMREHGKKFPSVNVQVLRADAYWRCGDVWNATQLYIHVLREAAHNWDLPTVRAMSARLGELNEVAAPMQPSLYLAA